MKRSTLTLSILTALLVSACGGNSSNDEQTKDPTPPKVTPTKPTTPSTGNTSTTGNTGNAGSSGSSAGSSASSSSSDPTPPISSGSAPSGGKPIVIESETGKTKEKDKDKDKEPKDDPIKKLETELAQARENLTEYQTAKQLADEELAKWKPDSKQGKSHASLKWRAKEDLREKFVGSGSKLGLNDSTDKKVGVKTIEVTLDKKRSELSDQEYGDLRANLEAFKTAQQEWIDADQHVYTLINNAYTAAQNVNKAQKKVDELAAEVRKLKADPIAAEVEFYTAKTQLTDLQYKAAEKEAEHNKAASEAEQNKTDLGTLQTIKGDLELAQKEAPKDETITKDLENVKKKIEENQKTQEKLTGKVSELAKQKTSLVAQLASTEERAKTAEEIAGNRGVIGNVGLSAQNYFLTVDKAEAVKSGTGSSKTIDAWKLTLKNGSTAVIDVKAAGGTTNGALGAELKPTGSDKAYGHFGNAETIQGTATGTKQITAYNSLNNDKTSIYGFIGDQFYSVGTVTPADVVEKMTDTRARYDGKALLKAAADKADKGKDNLIADVEATVNFKGGSLEGSFYNFKTYTATVNNSGTIELGQSIDDVANAEFKKSLTGNKVIFDASIKGNKFATESEKTGQANVYGYFYGKAAGELGGLVEYKDVFHGSFGGAKSSK